MRARILNLVLGFCILIGYPAFAQTDSSLKSALELSHKIIMDISRTRLEDAWQTIRANSSIPADRIDHFVREYDSHYVRSIITFGPSTGVELISQDMLGRSMMRITYLVKYEVTGVPWFMYFYRIGDEWVLSEFNYDLKSSTLFKVSMANTPNSTSSDLVLGEWQLAMERRIKALEGGPLENDGVVNEGGSVDEGRPEESVAQEEGSPDSLGGEGAPDEGELKETSSVEGRMSEIVQRLDEITLDLSLVKEDNQEILRGLAEADVFVLEQEIARLKGLINILAKQHPYAEFSED